MTDEEWQERLKAAVAETERKRARKKEERAELARRRAWGLTRRHAAKLARAQPPVDLGETEGTPNE